MHVDPKTNGLPLTADQRFFVSCWLNMVHQYSLDSHRVRTMNPRNILREMLRLYDVAHANEEDWAMVCDEALLVLTSDTTLKRPPFASTTAALTELLERDGKGKRTNEELARHVARELLHAVDACYIDESLALLGETLLADSPSGSVQERKRTLADVTGGLLSTLIDGGASLESLYQLYRQILVRSGGVKPYVFGRKLGLLTAILKQEPKSWQVLFAIDNVSDTKDFPTRMGGITFAGSPAGWDTQDKPARAYLKPSSRRLFAELTIQAKDVRSAGTEAYASISNVLDLARFEYEREKVQLADEFLAAASDRPDHVRRYPIPRVVPNPDAIVGAPDLGAFVASVDELLSSERFSQEGRDRILSAFRLYRLGADTNSFENKLANWWTAIEFLVRGLKGGKQIGSAVEYNVAPVLCLAYPATLLLDVRYTLARLETPIVDPATGNALDLRTASTPELYRTLTRADLRPAISTALASEPYVQWRTDQILSALSQPATYLAFLRQHDRRIRWQIQRLWRARCDIVHSARRSVSDVLLSANLEFYLKVTLMTLLTELRRIKTLSSPEEFFERQHYIFNRLMTSLDASSVAELEATLATHGAQVDKGLHYERKAVIEASPATARRVLSRRLMIDEATRSNADARKETN